jgi:hypothetical protein
MMSLLALLAPAQMHGQQVFYESFNGLTTDKGGNDGYFENDDANNISICDTELSDASLLDNKAGWGDFTYLWQGYQCIRISSKKKSGQLTTPAITLNGSNATLTFCAAGYGSDETTLYVEASNGTLTYNGTSAGKIAIELPVSEKGTTVLANQTYTVSISGVNASTTLSFSTVSSKSNKQRAFLDEIKVVKAEAAQGNVTGKVTCDGVGLAGITVSDGIEVTTTDAEGNYSLQSKKKYGYVFISIPSGYEAPLSGNVPQFFKRFTSTDESVAETANFELEAVDNTKHAVIAMADFHLVNKYNDLELFDQYAKDINATAKQLEDEGYKVYGVSLGDEGWDKHWEESQFFLTDVYKKLQILDMPFFHCMGNNDNLLKKTDFDAEKAWMEACGPVYYSFNIGGMHYVVLDNIVESEKDGYFTESFSVIDEEMEWLKKDLAHVADKSRPLFIIMHAPLYKAPNLTNTEFFMDGGQEFVDALKDFSNVHILSGHKHCNYNVKEGNIYEHNTGAICGTKWETQKYAGINLGYDGAPGGYAIYKSDDANSVNWYYKAEEYDKDFQFRAYDLNNTYIDAATYAPEKKDEVSEVLNGYDKAKTDNEVMVYVWNYDPSWTISITQDGEELEVTRVNTVDPLHILAYDAPATKDGKLNSKLQTKKSANFFKATAKDATSTIHIKVTDAFNNVYEQDLKRPQDLNTFTGIKKVEVESNKSAKAQDNYYYNLQGQRIDNPQRGIFIHQGKKVVLY